MYTSNAGIVIEVANEIPDRTDVILQVFGQRQRVTHQSRTRYRNILLNRSMWLVLRAVCAHVVLREAQRLTTSAHRHTLPPGTATGSI